MKELDKQLDEDGKIVEVNWEMEKELAQRYKVNGIPCLLVFNKGKLVGRYSGLLNAEEFLQKVEVFNQNSHELENKLDVNYLPKYQAK